MQQIHALVQLHLHCSNAIHYTIKNFFNNSINNNKIDNKVMEKT